MAADVYPMVVRRFLAAGLALCLAASGPAQAWASLKGKAAPGRKMVPLRLALLGAQDSSWASVRFDDPRLSFLLERSPEVAVEEGMEARERPEGDALAEARRALDDMGLSLEKLREMPPEAVGALGQKLADSVAGEVSIEGGAVKAGVESAEGRALGDPAGTAGVRASRPPSGKALAAGGAAWSVFARGAPGSARVSGVKPAQPGKKAEPAAGLSKPRKEGRFKRFLRAAPLATVGLIAANQIAHAARPSALGEDWVLRPARLSRALSQENLGEIAASLGTQVSSMFAHLDYAHLYGNLAVLFMFGWLVERWLGRLKFLGLYAAAGVLAGLGTVAANWGSWGSFAGASCAVSGLIGASFLAWGWLKKDLEKQPEGFWPNARNFARLWLLIGAPFMVLGDVWELIFHSSGGNVHHAGHLMGYAAGFLLVLIPLLLRRWLRRP